jgi:hypothetical protein
MYDYLQITEVGYCYRKERQFVILSVVCFSNRHQVREDYWCGDSELAVMPTCAWLCQEYDCDNASLQRSLYLPRIEKTPLPMRLIPNPLTFNPD